MLLTGGRRNEIGQARRECIDWDRRTLLVPLSKSGKPRHIALNAAAVALLRSIRPLPGNPFIFPTRRTGRPSPTFFSAWTRIKNRAGLSDLRLHDLRHTFASSLINEGVSIYVVQQLLGHANIKTTQRYSHLSRETLQSAAEAAGRFVEDTLSGASITMPEPPACEDARVQNTYPFPYDATESPTPRLDGLMPNKPDGFDRGRTGLPLS
ncbi:tyrosine-type recombinase/integrase [Methylobacterium nigriterrae]|uniref:tyrosine-type recombinase/integrase n=1 Tax=Methylobacterium nigriterrae TaxID=3127512 RepID=UPI0030136ECF